VTSFQSPIECSEAKHVLQTDRERRRKKKIKISSEVNDTCKMKLQSSIPQSGAMIRHSTNMWQLVRGIKQYNGYAPLQLLRNPPPPVSQWPWSVWFYMSLTLFAIHSEYFEWQYGAGPDKNKSNQQRISVTSTIISTK
jgi:hypothetical protein